jgi:hypothetical protein
MKLRSIKSLVIMWILLSAGLYSCTKFKSYQNPADGGNPLSNTSNFQAVINGVQWQGVESTDTAYSEGQGITIYGVSSLNQSLSINLNGVSTGTYPLNSTTISIATYIDGSSANLNAFTTGQSADTSQAGGEVTVTSIDTVNNTISGTFQLNVFRSSDGQSKTLTQGLFNKIPYTVAPPQSENADTFYVTVDSASFIPPEIESNTASGQYVIVGSSLDGTMSVSLTMPQNVTPGSYNLNYSGLTYIGQYVANDSTILESQGNGTLQILENNSVTGRLRGNFNFQALPLSGTAAPATLTNGYFSVDVQ